MYLLVGRLANAKGAHARFRKSPLERFSRLSTNEQDSSCRWPCEQSPAIEAAEQKDNDRHVFIQGSILFPMGSEAL